MRKELTSSRHGKFGMKDVLRSTCSMTDKVDNSWKNPAKHHISTVDIGIELVIDQKTWFWTNYTGYMWLARCGTFMSWMQKTWYTELRSVMHCWNVLNQVISVTFHNLWWRIHHLRQSKREEKDNKVLLSKVSDRKRSQS